MRTTATATDFLLEFVLASEGSDIWDAHSLIETPGLAAAELERSPWATPRACGADIDTFLLHHGRPVATLRARQLLARPAGAPFDGEMAPGTVLLDRFVTRPREGSGCSYRLLLTFWATQWLVAHRGVSAVVATCRADGLHRYLPMGFRQISPWFRSMGPVARGLVVIRADTAAILDTARMLGLDHILASAMECSGGRVPFPRERHLPGVRPRAAGGRKVLHRLRRGPFSRLPGVREPGERLAVSTCDI